MLKEINMKRAFLFVALYLITVTIIFADDAPENLRVDAYYIRQENITDTVNYAIARWTSHVIMTPYLTRTSVYNVEIELFQSENLVEKIILENGQVGGRHIFFERVYLVVREFSSQNLVGFYDELFGEEFGQGYAISIYESESIGSNTELVTLVLIRK